MVRFLFVFALLISVPAFAQQAIFNLASPLLEEGKPMPLSAASEECGGSAISPMLQWSGAPPDAKSYTITMFDPDSGKLHWAVFNIPADVWSLPADAGAEKHVLPYPSHALPNSWGKKQYTGACPPPGEKHLYQFSIYAMRDALAFYPLSAIGKSTVNWLRDNSLAHTTLSVTFSNPAR